MSASEKHFYKVRRGNDAVVIFVHGLFGHYRKTWDEFPNLITQDPSLDHCDILCWGYPSSVNMSVRGRFKFLGKRSPDIPTVAEALITDLNNDHIGGDYSDVILVGHSMGGLVIKHAMIMCLNDKNKRTLLDRIQHIVLYATPTAGVDLKKFMKVHPQAKDLSWDSEIIKNITNQWVTRVLRTREDDPWEAGYKFLPVTAVVGSQDNVVEDSSAKMYCDDVKCVPGDHFQVCKPSAHEDSSYQVLKDIILKKTLSRIIVNREELVAANTRIAKRAKEVIYATGSRSRDEEYLRSIETRLLDNPSLVYYRILMGPPHHEVLKDHLKRVLELRPHSEIRGRNRVFIALYQDLKIQPEFFLCGNEKCCLVVIPPLTSIGEYTTALILTNKEHVRGYEKVVKALYSLSQPLNTENDVDKLELYRS